MFGLAAKNKHPTNELDDCVPRRTKRVSLKSALQLTAVVAGCLVLVAGTWAIVDMSAAKPNPVLERKAELRGRSVAHAFIIDAYEQCMAPEGANRYRCLKSTADAAKAKSMTAFQIVGVFKDYGVNVNSMDFPAL
jgi:hypothetical protein